MVLVNISLAQVSNKMATSSTTIPNPEHVGGHPPVIIVTDELEELEEEPPYDIRTSEVEDEASATRVSQNKILYTLWVHIFLIWYIQVDESFRLKRLFLPFVLQ